MNGNDMTIGGVEFKFSKLDAFKQFHITRKVGPVLADLLPAMKSAKAIQSQENMSEEDKFDKMAELADPLLKGLAKLSDADSEFILNGLLYSVEMKQAVTGNWARVSDGKMMMIQNLELPVILQLAGKAFVYNLAGFFTGSPRK